MCSVEDDWWQYRKYWSDIQLGKSTYSKEIMDFIYAFEEKYLGKNKPCDPSDSLEGIITSPWPEKEI